MFFQNLKQMKEQIEKMLEIEEIKLDKILKEHDWAEYHISSAKNNIEDVFNFLNSGENLS